MDVNEENQEASEDEDSSPQVDDTSTDEDGDSDESTDEAEAQQSQNTVPYDRFSQVNAKMRQYEKELQDAKSQLENINKGNETPDEELANMASTDPVRFVEQVVKKRKLGGSDEIEALRKQLSAMSYQQEINAANSRYSDFGTYKQEIHDLIQDENIAVDPGKPGAIDLYYMIAKSRRSSANISKVIKKAGEDDKVPHTESAKKKTKSKATDYSKMSLEELEKEIGFSERRSNF